MNEIAQTEGSRYISNKTAEVVETYDEVSFDAIEDGGYHQGYWRAKYSSSR